ncbi:MAG: DNA adenine methylase [Candidatus Izemoplasmatales bacterium]
MIYGHLLKTFGGDFMAHPSPLRYPGGKMKLANFIYDAILLNDIQGGTYIEPFAGGSNVALFLLFQEQVKKIVINDIDRAIYAVWHSVLYNTDKLCNKIIETPITINIWEEQKKIQKIKNDANLFDLGFSTFFLNRTNRSGIINAGPIGGKSQDGNWKIDARFNKKDLIKRIRKIALYKSRINLYNKDAIDLICDISPELDEHSLIYFDPPYYNKGSSLYTNSYKHEDHKALSEFIKGLNCKWILTYDYIPDIINMYRSTERRLLTLCYTASKKISGNEMIAFSKYFTIPQNKYSAINIE